MVINQNHADFHPYGWLQFTVRNDQPIPMTKSSLGYKVSKAALNMCKPPYLLPTCCTEPVRILLHVWILLAHKATVAKTPQHGVTQPKPTCLKLTLGLVMY